MNSEFLGARASNAGDDFHELWAARHAIRLLAGETDLQALAVEGVAAADEEAGASRSWDGVDCALYFGGERCEKADRVIVEQLKYSAAAPTTPWSVARLTYGKRSVLGRLAVAWKKARSLAREQTPIEVVFVSNQPVDEALRNCVSRFANNQGTLVEPSSDEQRIQTSTGLQGSELAAFCSALRFDTGVGSRFAMEERVIRSIAEWSESDIQHGVLRLREFVRSRMRPEHAGQLITRSSVFLHFGAHTADVLLPCPSALTLVDHPIKRESAGLVSQTLLQGHRFVAMHGQGGIGKTTALQQIETDLPEGSVMIIFDCYGGGTYQDPSALRHRPADAYMQLINQTAIRLGLPLLLMRSVGDDLPRLFVRRLAHAATALKAKSSGALLVIAIDAADNAIVAAENRVPSEHAFVLDFVRIAQLPDNVRFVVSARTGRLAQLCVPSNYVHIELKPFDLHQTTDFVRRRAEASDSWIEDFHHLSGGVPRVQAYALDGHDRNLGAALNRLQPTGKKLDDVFDAQFAIARKKSGDAAIERLIGGLVALPRPIPLAALAEVVDMSSEQILDICSDLSPGVRQRDGFLSFADEDFEDFLRRRSSTSILAAREAAATWMLAKASIVPYAAMHVAEALVAAGRGPDLLTLTEREPAPAVITDPVIRRETEVQRLRLAIKVCRSSEDVPRALRFVLRGAEGLKTEAALRELLLNHPDMAAAFAYETVGRLLLSNPRELGRHGRFLFHRLAAYAQRGDRIAYRAGVRSLQDWLNAREMDRESDESRRADKWPIDYDQICSAIEAALVMRGPDAAISLLTSWSPWTIALETALRLPAKLISEGRADLIEAVCSSGNVGLIGRMLCSVPLAISGRAVPSAALADGLTALQRRRPRIRPFFEGHSSSRTNHSSLLRSAVTAAEFLVARHEPCSAVDRLLEAICAPDFRRIEKRHSFEAQKIDLLLRCFILQEIRNGRTPVKGEFFLPRPTPEAKQSNSHHSSVAHDRQHDEELQDLIGDVFPVYLARARRIAGQTATDGRDDELERATAAMIDRNRSSRRQHEWRELQSTAAISLMTLAGVGYPPSLLKQHVDAVHWKWIGTSVTPTAELIVLQSFFTQLHENLVRDLANTASKVVARHTSASEKCASLVDLARLVRPLSPDDAHAIFNHAVEVAGHVDREAMSQIELVNQLILRGKGHFNSPNAVAQNASAFIIDAKIRLNEYDGFPWPSAMSALATLNGPRALADAARWDDENLADLRATLPHILSSGIDQEWLSLEHAAALALLSGSDDQTLDRVVAKAVSNRSVTLPLLAETAAYDSVVRHQRISDTKLTQLIEGAKLSGPWCSVRQKQDAFVLGLPQDQNRSSSYDFGTRSEPNEEHVRQWQLTELTDPELLRTTVEAWQVELRNRKQYTSVRSLLQEARSAVPFRNRITHLDALLALAAARAMSEASWILIDAAREWRSSPAVVAWCKAKLPPIVAANLLHYAVKPGHYGLDDFDVVLELIDLQPDQLADLMLDGIEANVNALTAERIHHIVGVMVTCIWPDAAAALADWYVSRLANRIPVEERLAATSESDYPINVDLATARIIFAYMGDIDVRARWRAAHAARRLASLGCVNALCALVSMYEARQVPAFRSESFPFYWLAARLWFVLAWERIAAEDPTKAYLAGDVLINAALDDAFPHMLIRATARDTSLVLMASGWSPSILDAASSLDRVNKSLVPRAKRDERVRRSSRANSVEVEREGRFHFNELDTKPYWYEPLIRSFAKVSMNQFTKEAERWIMDSWGFSADIYAWDREPRRAALERYNWSLKGHSHGELPTVERLSTHLEWNAMWCAAGELLKSEPLVKLGRAGDDWDSLDARVRRNRPTDPPIWCGDLLHAVPLVQANWTMGNATAVEWKEAVGEQDHRNELFPEDRGAYVVVCGRASRRLTDREETINVSSALADARTSGSLLRALQTMESAWDYKLPDEGEDPEISSGTFRLTGWLTRHEADGGLDRKDDLRSEIVTIPMQPGRAVTEGCNLREHAAQPGCWLNSTTPDEVPMFLFEAWGLDSKSDDRYDSQIVAKGHRLLVHRDQLRRFLGDMRADLIVEVEVDRSVKEDRQHSFEEDDSREARFDRIYRLGFDGELNITEGPLGSWLSDRQ